MKYKVCLTGKLGVGKTKIFNFIGKVERKYAGTDRCDHHVRVERRHEDDNFEETDVTLQIWDTAGMERFETLTESYYRHSNAVIVVFSFGSSESFTNVFDEVKRIRNKDYAPGAVFFLVGNMAEMNHDSAQVSKERVRDFLKSHPGLFAEYMKISSKTSEGITELFEEVAYVLVSKRVQPVEPRNDLQEMYGDTRGNKGCCRGASHERS